MKINVSKIEVAEIQLNEAIFLFFDNANPIIIETLVGAVMGVLRPLGKKYGIKAPIHDSDKIKAEYKKVWIKDYLHKAQNFCKHADNDQKAVLSYETGSLPFNIFEACHLFRHLSSEKCLKYRQSQAAIMYEVWFWLKYPEFLKDQAEVNKFLQTAGMPENFNTSNLETLGLLANSYRIKL